MSGKTTCLVTKVGQFRLLVPHYQESSLDHPGRFQGVFTSPGFHIAPQIPSVLSTSTHLFHLFIHLGSRFLRFYFLILHVRLLTSSYHFWVKSGQVVDIETRVLQLTATNLFLQLHFVSFSHKQFLCKILHFLILFSCVRIFSLLIFMPTTSLCTQLVSLLD